MAILIEDDRDPDDRAGNQAFGIFPAPDPGQAGPEHGTSWPSKKPLQPSQHRRKSRRRVSRKHQNFGFPTNWRVPGPWGPVFGPHMLKSNLQLCIMDLVGYRDAEYEAQRVIPVQFLRGVQVKNRAYKDPQGKTVLAAWVNLEAGL